MRFPDRTVLVIGGAGYVGSVLVTELLQAGAEVRVLDQLVYDNGFALAHLLDHPFRHYWIVTKLLLTVIATVILLLHTQPIDEIAAIAAQVTLSSTDFRQLRLQLVGDAAAAIFVLLMITTLSIYKPWGLTLYGVRKQYEAAPTWQPVARRSTTMGRQYSSASALCCSLSSCGTFSAEECMVTESRH